MMKLLRKWWFWIAVLVVLALFLMVWGGFCSQFQETDRGDATHEPNSTNQLTVESFYG